MKTLRNRHLRRGVGLLLCLMFLVLLGYFVTYEIGQRPTSFFGLRIHKTSEYFQWLMDRANGLPQSKIGLRDVTEGEPSQKDNSESTALKTAVGEDLLESVQTYLRDLSALAEQYRNERIYRHDDQYLKYMRCPTTIHRKMLNMTRLKNIYIPDMPLLMWNEHLNKSEHERLRQFGGIYGWNMEYNDIASALKLLDSPNNQYLFDDRLINGKLPKNDLSCIRCAVLGNGGMMNGSKKGKEIDEHDYVFRVNTALTKGYEDDVGTKTSFYCFTPITLSNTLAISRKFGFMSPPGNEDVRYVFFADNVWTYQLLNAYIRGEPPPRSNDKYNRWPPKFPKRLTAENVKIVHPDFERYLKWSWVNSKNQHEHYHRPTTGAIMLLFALHTCDEVNAYGFGGSYEKFSEHYYDKIFQKHVSKANHDNHAENDLWERLHKFRVINFYHRE